MRATSVNPQLGIVGLLPPITSRIAIFGQAPARAATDAGRIVKFAQNDTVAVEAKHADYCRLPKLRPQDDMDQQDGFSAESPGF